jgi:serine/threonine-protein kinase
LLATLARAELALARGDADAAIAPTARLATALAGHPQRAYMREDEWRVMLLYGKALARAARCTEAMVPLHRALTLATQLYDTNVSPSFADTQIAVANCELVLGHRTAARTLLDSARTIQATHPELGPQYREPLQSLNARLNIASSRP